MENNFHSSSCALNSKHLEKKIEQLKNKIKSPTRAHCFDYIYIHLSRPPIAQSFVVIQISNKSKNTKRTL